MPLVVEDGIDDRTADFEIALDSNDSELRRPARVVVLETRGGRAEIDFPVKVGGDLTHRWLWIRIAQRNQVVLQLELAVVQRERKG